MVRLRFALDPPHTSSYLKNPKDIIGGEVCVGRGGTALHGLENPTPLAEVLLDVFSWSQLDHQGISNQAKETTGDAT